MLVGKRSNHIYVRYFSVTDKVENKELKITYYPIEKIVADYSTKLVQSALFVYQWDAILGAKKEEYDMHENWYKKKLIEYDL